MKGPGPLLDHLLRHLPLALSGEDPEGVHQVRVAGRRLEVYLYLLGFRVLRDDLRRLVRGAGRVRDLEVALSRPLPEGFSAFLREELRRARGELAGLLASPWLEALVRALGVLPPLDRGRARKRLARLEARLGERFRELSRNPGPEALHAYRRALRRVRYAKEFLGAPTRWEKAAQEALGAFGDLEVLRGLLLAYLGGGQDLEARRFLAEVERAREEAWRRALEALDLELTEAL